ncbi:eCIS core domain-containing protein [Arthrobacter humicola]|uniref:eCIS core domain-containing protein n=1 Tax=Arthrobacter humicola TaxID=409291 RepID=UPI001FAC38A9|nr:DUF4157 domain-containing protein [Arthrobacter humicola]
MAFAKSPTHRLANQLEPADGRGTAASKRGPTPEASYGDLDRMGRLVGNRGMQQLVIGGAHLLMDEGSVLPPLTRAEVEAQFGVSLARVRTHRGTAATKAASAVNAQAFTVGEDIVLGGTAPADTSSGGRALLVHEVVHSIQQGPQLAVPAVSTMTHASDTVEREAAGILPPTIDHIPRIARQPVDAGVPDEDQMGMLGAGTDGLIPDAGVPLGDLGELALKALFKRPDLMRGAFDSSIENSGLEATKTLLDDFRAETEKLKGDRSSMYGVTPEQSVIDTKIELREWAIKVWEDLLTDLEQFMDAFEAWGLLLASRLLSLSEARVVQEQRLYGLRKDTKIESHYSMAEKGAVYSFRTTYSLSDNEKSRGLSIAASALAEKARVIRTATDAVNDTMGMVPSSEAPLGEGFGSSMSYGIQDPLAHAAAEQVLSQARKDYDVLRYEKEAEFPILAAFTPIDRTGGTSAIDTTVNRLRTVASGGTKAAEALVPEVEIPLENIRRVREGIADNDIRIWEMRDIVELTKDQLHIPAGSSRAIAIDERVNNARTSHIARDVLIAVVALALGLASAPITGGASLTFSAAVVAGSAAAGAAGLSAYLALEHLQEFQLERAKAGTDFDKARALSQEDPSLFWLALDIVGAISDIGPAVAAFKELAVFARAAVRARRTATTAQQIARVESAELARLRDAAQHRLATAGTGESVMRSAERSAVREQAELKGVYSKWETELNSEARAILKDDKLAAIFRDMDPEVRTLLSPMTVTKRQVDRLRRLLDRIPPRHRYGLKEFFYHHRDKLDDAIGDLEHLFSHDIGKDVDAAVAALEEGLLPSGELRSVGRTGLAGDVPDLAPDIAKGHLPREAGQLVPIDLLRRTRRVLGKKISDAPESVKNAWEAAQLKVRANQGPLSATNYPTLYKAAQKEFWANVRESTAANKWFEDNGFDFGRTASGAPAVALQYSGRRGRKEFAIELDHILPKASGSNWGRALDADNLQFLTGWDNWLLDQIEKLSPDLKR